MKFLDKVDFKVYGKEKLDAQIKKMEDYVKYVVEYKSPSDGKNNEDGEQDDLEIGDDEKQKLLDTDHVE